ncbi:MAG: DUF4342 domain-containing protein [Lachnospiraceae bacterium]|nr:DUF4342 domain-containing protein [Lachnospiraceae bacterium]
MEITLEAIEKVMEETGVDYKTAKEALTASDGDVEAAIKAIQPQTQEISEDIKALMEKLKKKVNEGNVDRVQIKKGDEVVLSVPVNVGIVGGLVGLAAAPWALIAGSLAAFGFGCRLVIVKKDGTCDEIV